MRRVARLFSEELAPFQITPPQLYLLSCLQESEGLRPREIADLICIDASSITSLLDRTERAGLLERRIDQDDRRSFQIFLTDLGRQRLAESTATAAALNERLRTELLANFPDDQVELFLAMLRGIGEVGKSPLPADQL